MCDAHTTRLNNHSDWLQSLEGMKNEAKGFGLGVKASLGVRVTAVVAAIGYVIAVLTGGNLPKV